jgi:cold shock CspA family protein
MGRSQETYNKKEVRNKKEKKRKEKAQKRLARKDTDKKNSLDDMIAYVDENGILSATPPDPDKKQVIDVDAIEISVPARSEENQRETLREGTVSYYNDSKGYGFIRDAQTGQSIFVHANNLMEDIREGNKVSFEIGSGQKGPLAMQVRLVK